MYSFHFLYPHLDTMCYELLSSCLYMIVKVSGFSYFLSLVKFIQNQLYVVLCLFSFYNLSYIANVGNRQQHPYNINICILYCTITNPLRSATSIPFEDTKPIWLGLGHKNPLKSCIIQSLSWPKYWYFSRVGEELIPQDIYIIWGLPHHWEYKTFVHWSKKLIVLTFLLLQFYFKEPSKFLASTLKFWKK